MGGKRKRTCHCAQMLPTRPAVNGPRLVRNYYVLPCCLLLLNLGVELASYKAKMLADVYLRTAAIMGVALAGASIISFLIAPAIVALIGLLHRGSRQGGGGVGELLFLVVLGAAVFWLYYRVYIIGPESVLPASWQNPVTLRG